MSDYRALYRKWRPSTFDDVCGQEHVTDILKYEVENNKLSHAYLFSGSRGTGKTSCAKILAKAVNCLNSKGGNPCNECSACKSIDSGICTDVMELDAASNTGVDNVRNMKDEIAFTPSELKYRVYIIDEVHMMSISAFNALLKTLEEPPSYVIFILATTEYNKLPTTIVSRCQRFDFRRISNEVIAKRLKHISSSEGIDITDDGARVIARISRGGMRDAISLLELSAGAHKTVDDKLVFDVAGSGNRENAYKILSSVSKKDYDTVYDVIDSIVMSSADISVFWQEIIDAYRDLLVVKNVDNARSYLDLTDVEYESLKKIAEGFSMPTLIYHISVLENAMGDMQRAFNSKRSIAEIALTRMCDEGLSTSNEALLARICELEKQISMLKLGAVPINTSESPIQKKEKATEPTGTAEKKAEPKQQTSKPVPYPEFSSVIERIDKVKRSLSVQFKNCSVYKYPDNTFLIRMSPFFAKSLKDSAPDLAILRGAIAEKEGVSPTDIKLVIESADNTDASDLSLEIEKALK